ncbi:uncharacterized protein LOC124135323 [Haliotis rufescens]|uniref:uncharacterized protein LOC124135323 n=1 Tax=Haliotis rufescens TaxID=6454 RepID=UPI001EB06C42|nr:uncharacterized protein LOC124135323 [Haliotis rufescens]
MYKNQLSCVLVTALVVLTRGQNLNECRRGVKRPHPTQENAYQIFSRNGWRSQWIDQECPLYQIYDQDACQCTDGYRRTTTPAPATTTPVPATPVPNEDPGAEGPNCGFHQPHPENPSMYARKTDNGWITEDCNWPFYTGLVWDQNTCRCEWGPDRTFPPRKMDQSQAVPSPCLVMLNMTFDQAIEDQSRGLWLKRTNADNARVIQDHTAVGGGCALFQDSSVAIPFFKSNTLGKSFHITFRFKPCDNNPSAEITVIHNGCSDVNRLPPTLRVSYRPWSREFSMEFESENDVQPTREGCTLTQSGTGWNDVDIRYEDNVLEVSVNSAICIRSSLFSGDIKTTDCPLTLPGENTCVHLDEMVITRGCPQQ